MSKRVQIAVIREATLNAKPTDTHYLAEGGLRIPRADARALKGTTLYYEVIVDLGELKGFNFVRGRDIPVYETDSEPVIALDAQALKLTDVKAVVEAEVPATSISSVTTTVDSTALLQNSAPVEPVASEPAPATPEAPVKRKPGRPRKVVQDLAAAQAPAPEPEPEVTEEIPAVEAAVVEPFADFEVTEAETEEKQDDESTFLIDPTGAPPAPQPKPEFSFDVDEDEAPPPPPVRNSAPAHADFEVGEEETTAEPAVEPEPEVPVQTLNTDDYADVETGLFDE